MPLCRKSMGIHIDEYKETLTLRFRQKTVEVDQPPFQGSFDVCEENDVRVYFKKNEAECHGNVTGTSVNGNGGFNKISGDLELLTPVASGAYKCTESSRKP